MNCNFDLLEFYNVIIGGLFTGIIASFLFVCLSREFEVIRFKKGYGYLKSFPKNEFDWEAYSMREDDGRIRQDNPNGSKLSISIKRDRLNLILIHDNRRWNGVFKLESYNFGIVTYKYEREHEYGKRECVIGSYIENGEKYDYLFLIPTNNKIYFIDCEKHVVKYDYGNELFIRKKDRD